MDYRIGQKPPKNVRVIHENMRDRAEINTRLLDEILVLFPSVEACAKAFGVNQCSLGDFINLKMSPLCTAGHTSRPEYEWREICVTVAHGLGFSVADLFPPELYPLPTGGNEPLEYGSCEIPFSRRFDTRQILPRVIPAGHAITRIAFDPRGDGATDADYRLLRSMMRVLLRRLSYRHREVLKLLYGLGDGFTYTREEVAEIFRISREHVRQIEVMAMHKLELICRRRDQHIQTLFQYWDQSTFEPLGPAPDESPLTL